MATQRYRLRLVIPASLPSERARTALWFCTSVLGVLYGLVGHAWPAAVLVLAVVGTLGLLVPLRLSDRWQWPWVRLAIVAASVPRASERADIGGSRVADAGRWIAEHPPGSVPDIARMFALAVVGRTGEARAILDGLVATTPKERAHLVRMRIYLDFLDAGTADYPSARAIGASIDDDAERRRHLAWLAHSEALSLALAGEDFRTRPRPTEADGLPLGARDTLLLWRTLLWPAQWLLGMFLLTWALLEIVRTFV